MCGIAGFIDQQNPLPDEDRYAILSRMCQVIAHRGPDDQGLMIADSAALGMQRLAIIDLAGGRQPIANEDSTVTVIFNGEIYNYQELQQELRSRGHRFQTDSDTEVIVHAYEQYGAECVRHLRGMFAFAVWNSLERELFVARDPTGEKPLFYSVTPRRSFLFSSELKSLLQHPGLRHEVDLAALDAYLTLGYVPEPLSIFRNVQKLPPGHSLSLKDGRVSITQYWDFPTDPAAARPVEEYREELRALLEESVRLRLVADVPVGAFLSGGIDSSIVVGLMAQQMTRPVKTFSIGFCEDSHSELQYARVTASHFGTEHRELIVTPEVCDIVDDLVWHLDEPFADPSALPTYAVSRLAREEVTVVLSGDGGDELFGGYTRYLEQERRRGFEAIPRCIRRGALLPLSRRLPHGAVGRNYLHNVALDPLDRYGDSISIFTHLTKPSLYSGELHRHLAAGTPVGARLAGHAAKVQGGDFIDQLLYLDSKTYLPGDILTKVDRMSMAVSLEARVPLLDHRLIDYVGRIPARLKLRAGQSKYVLRHAIRDLVPAEILDRPKQGFGVPIDRWIKERLGERIRVTLTESRTRQRGYFDPEYVNLLLREDARGRRDHSKSLWTLFMLELWHRAFIDNAVTDRRPLGQRPLQRVASSQTVTTGHVWNRRHRRVQ